MKGTLYLIPSLLGDGPVENCLPPYNIQLLRSLDEYIVEDVRSARRFLIKACKSQTENNEPNQPSTFNTQGFIDSLTFHIYNEHSKTADISDIMKSLMSGKNMGLISEAGCPCLADPGMEIVQFAHRHDIGVIPLVGPSSILLALMSSGLNGQNFAFNGYLPKKEEERKKVVKQLELLVIQKKQTQIFIETPYRNDPLIKDLLAFCRDETLLCIASDITLSTERIKTLSVREWRNLADKRHPAATGYNDHPSVFLIGDKY